MRDSESAARRCGECRVAWSRSKGGSVVVVFAVVDAGRSRSRTRASGDAGLESSWRRPRMRCGRHERWRCRKSGKSGFECSASTCSQTSTSLLRGGASSADVPPETARAQPCRGRAPWPSPGVCRITAMNCSTVGDRGGNIPGHRRTPETRKERTALDPLRGVKGTAGTVQGDTGSARALSTRLRAGFRSCGTRGNLDAAVAEPAR